MSIKWLFCFAVASLLVSCTAVLDLDPRKQFVVVHAVLINEPRQVIDLCYSSYLSEDHMSPIDHAKVWVEEENPDGTIRRTYAFDSIGDGRYESYFWPEFGTRYNLRVVLDGCPEITASTQYPCAENFVDRASMRRYTYTFETVCIPLYLWVYGQSYNLREDGYFQSLYICETDGFSDPFNEVALLGFEGGQKHWRYLRYEINMSTDSPMVSYDAVRNFTYFELSVFPDFYSWSTASQYAPRVVFESVSEDYDRYLKDVVSLELKLEHEEQNDFTSLYDPNSTYTNVKNAIGIFGASYRKIKEPLIVNE